MDDGKLERRPDWTGVFRSVKNRAVACDGGVRHGWRTPGFLRGAGERERRKFFPKPPWVERMRSTGNQGWLPRACGAGTAQRNGFTAVRKIPGQFGLRARKKLTGEEPFTS